GPGAACGKASGHASNAGERNQKRTTGRRPADWWGEAKKYGAKTKKHSAEIKGRYAKNQGCHAEIGGKTCEKNQTRQTADGKNQTCNRKIQ
ncbi:MAG: hypothetical protein D4R48_02715, partial [Nitrosomonadales bacterium]